MDYIDNFSLRESPYVAVIVYGIAIAIVNPSTVSVLGRNAGGLIGLVVIRVIWHEVQERATIGIYTPRQYDYLTLIAAVFTPLGALVASDLSAIYNMGVSYLYMMMFLQLVSAPVVYVYDWFST